MRAKREVWLRPNRRALGLGLVLPGIGMLLGTFLAAAGGSNGLGWRLAGWALAGVSGLVIALLLRELLRPRLAFSLEAGLLLVYLRAGPPWQVPIGIVEGFLLGQGPAMLGGARHARAETRNLVIRLAEAASEWAHREVKPALGTWCGSYITLRGTWCEPLSVAMVNRLNVRLAEVQHSTQGVAG